MALEVCPTCDLAMIEMYDLRRRVKGIGCAIHGIPDTKSAAASAAAAGYFRSSSADTGGKPPLAVEEAYKEYLKAQDDKESAHGLGKFKASWAASSATSKLSAALAAKDGSHVADGNLHKHAMTLVNHHEHGKSSASELAALAKAHPTLEKIANDHAAAKGAGGGRLCWGRPCPGAHDND